MSDEASAELGRVVPDPARMCGVRLVDTPQLVVGEWSMRGAAWTDRHQHDEVNYVLEGELHVTSEGVTTVVTAGAAVRVPAGQLARYAAPTFARMVYVYGPSADGHAATDTCYEELPNSNR